MSSPEAAPLTPADKEQLLAVAVRAIDRGLHGERFAPRVADYPPALAVPRATFVTLHVATRLRGCIGTLEARRALVEDVSANAYAAAFEDPRFPALTRAEYPRLDIHISMLTAPQPLPVASEAELLAQLRPFVDGLILSEGARRGTFLPSVWEQLSDPREFLRHLKRKAGLPDDYWSAAIEVQRYTAESIP
jgi:hypothetical protein